MTSGLLVATALVGLAASVAGAIAPERIRTQLVVALTVAACGCGFAVAAEVLATGHVAVVHTDRLLPLSGFSLELDRFGALFVAVSRGRRHLRHGLSARLHGHGLSSRTASCVLPLFVTTLLLVPAAASVTTFLFLWELMAITSLLLVLVDHRRRAEVQVAAQWYAVMTQFGAAALLVGLVLLATHAGSQSFTAIAAASAHLPAVGARHRLRAGGGRLRVQGRHGAAARVAAPGPSRGPGSGVGPDVGGDGQPRDLRHRPGGRRAARRWAGVVVADGHGPRRAVGPLRVLALGHEHRPQAPVGLFDHRQHRADAARCGRLGLVRLDRAPPRWHWWHWSPHCSTWSSTPCSRDRCSSRPARSSRPPGRGTSTGSVGLLRRMPVTGSLFVVGGLTIAALPPLCGFVSEWLLLQAMLHGLPSSDPSLAIAMPIGVGVLALTGGLTALTFVKAIGIGLLGQPRSEPAAQAGEVPRSMWVGAGTLAGFCVVFGVAPFLVIPAVLDAARDGHGQPRPRSR